MKIVFIPSCGIGHEVLNGVWIVKQNVLTTVDTKIRCDEGAKLFKEGGKDIIFCTGGIFLPSYLQTKPASRLMKEYLVSQHRIPHERIGIEEESLDSWQNVEIMKKVLEDRGVKIDEAEISIVSHWLHTIRLKRILRYQGFRKIKRFGLRYPVGWRMWVSEFLNNILTLIDPAGRSERVQKEREKRKQS